MFRLIAVFVVTLVVGIVAPGSAAAQQDAGPPVVIKPQDRRAKFVSLREVLAESRKTTSSTRGTIANVRRRAETAIPRGEEPITEAQLRDITADVDAIEESLLRLTTELLREDQLDAAVRANRAIEALAAARDAVVDLEESADEAALEANLDAMEAQLDQVDQSLEAIVIPGPPGAPD